MQINYNRYKYTPDEMSEEQFISRFVVRKELFEELFIEIKNADFSIPNQHHIIVGQRGQGKTTLLRKFQIEVENDEKLSEFLLPVKFAEEQYRIRTLSRLWEEIAQYLQNIYKKDFEKIYDEIEKHFDDKDYDEMSFSYLEKRLKEKNKKLLILIDNIDELFSKLKPKEHHRLREILMESSSFIIIGGSTKMIEQHYDYGEAFYQFFKITTLEGLSLDECKNLLLAIADKKQKEKIEYVIKNTSSRIEVLRQLTGGVPRTIVILFDIFLDDKGNAFEDLLKILDEVTPLYKHRMDDLPPVLQDIVDTLAMNWDGMFTKEIAKKTRLQSKEVSAQLKQLEKYHFIESEYIGKNKIYKIQERFFNIWYLIRFGRKKDRQRVQWLVNFLESWFTKDEIKEKARSLIGSIERDEVTQSYAYYMCEAISASGIDLGLERRLKDIVRDFLDKKGSKLSKELSESKFDLINKSLAVYKNDEIEGMINILERISNKNAFIFNLLSLFYFRIKNYKKGIEYLIKGIGKIDTKALSSLSWLYFEEGTNWYKSLNCAKIEYEKNSNFFNTYIYSIILLWVEDLSKSYEKFLEWLDNYEQALDSKGKVSIYLNLLIAKGQYYKAKEFFELEKYQLKDRYKPIWYALMTLIQDEFPNEIKKMGIELQESVDSILVEIEELRKKYEI